MKKYFNLIIALFVICVYQSSLISQNIKKIDLDLVRESRSGNLEKIKELVKLGANVNFKDSSGYTPLMWASMYNNVELLEELVKLGANINVKDSNGNTALLLALTRGCTEIIKELIKLGADINVKNNQGNTVFSFEVLWEEQTALLKAINKVEENLEEFINQTDEIKNILINRWINLYEKTRDKSFLDKLKFAELYAKGDEKKKIGYLLKSIAIERPERFSDITIKTVG